ncbi:hypothetical protein CRENBAI_005912 [Crenichthys baileyi]|uniref:Uncharacterized protein n=1 Tax=Crenichthys baileyi TaxID=28760 RepID=A0AAV9SQI7_9TELE
MLRRKRSVSFGGFGWIDKSTVSTLRARKQDLLTIPNVPVEECPPSPPRTAPPTMKSAHFFDTMDKMEQVPEAAEMKTVPQRQKDDYIPYPRIEEVRQTSENQRSLARLWLSGRRTRRSSGIDSRFLLPDVATVLSSCMSVYD